MSDSCSLSNVLCYALSLVFAEMSGIWSKSIISSCTFKSVNHWSATGRTPSTPNLICECIHQRWLNKSFIYDFLYHIRSQSALLPIKMKSSLWILNLICCLSFFLSDLLNSKFFRYRQKSCAKFNFSLSLLCNLSPPFPHLQKYWKNSILLIKHSLLSFMLLLAWSFDVSTMWY